MEAAESHPCGPRRPSSYLQACPLHLLHLFLPQNSWYGQKLFPQLHALQTSMAGRSSVASLVSLADQWRSVGLCMREGRPLEGGSKCRCKPCYGSQGLLGWRKPELCMKKQLLLGNTFMSGWRQSSVSSDPQKGRGTEKTKRWCSGRTRRQYKTPPWCDGCRWVRTVTGTSESYLYLQPQITEPAESLTRRQGEQFLNIFSSFIAVARQPTL